MENILLVIFCHHSSLILVDDDAIVKTLHSIKSKSSSGHDGISTKFLKFLSPPFISPLRVIINQSLITGIYPEKLKIAKVIPLFKKDDKAKTDNYRPISPLSSIWKIFEKVVYNQLYKYFTQNKLFYDSQYGFRAKHSTEFATVELVDIILHSINNKELPLAIYMDLSKAFDTLDHTILSNKLRYYGITDISLKWFMPYLSQRTQYVEVNGIQSSKGLFRRECHRDPFWVRFYSWFIWMTFLLQPNTLLSFYMLMIPRYSVQWHILFQHCHMSTIF